MDKSLGIYLWFIAAVTGFVMVSTQTVVDDDWHLVFRAVSGVSPDPYTVWILPYTYNEDKEEATIPTDVFRGHYKSPLVYYWDKLDITEVRVTFYKDGAAVKEVVFDAGGEDDPQPDIWSWFDISRIKSSSWTDLNDNTNADKFSAEGDESNPRRAVKRFLAEKVTGGVCNDIAEGWFAMITSTGPDLCLPHGNPSGVDTPFFLYSTGNTAATTESEILLQGKTATQSTTLLQFTGLEWRANLAIDGNTDQDLEGNSCAHTTNAANSWWKVDLGESMCISRLVIYNPIVINSGANVGVANRIDDAQVRIGDDAADHTMNAECSGSPIEFEDTDDETQIFDIQCDLTGRYISVNLIDTSWLHMCEVRAFRCESGSFDYADVFTIDVKLNPNGNAPLVISCDTDPCEVYESAGFIDVHVSLITGTPIMDNVGRRKRQTSDSIAILTNAVVKTSKGALDTADAVEDYGTVFMETTEDITIPIEIVDDKLVEGDETFTVEVVPVTAYGDIMDTTSITVTIKDNDEVKYEFSSPTFTTKEEDGNTEAVITVKRSGDTTSQTAVVISTTDVSANDDEDYTTVDDIDDNDVVLFQPGEEYKDHPITIIGDEVPEGIESFQIELHTLDDASVLGNQDLAVVIIEDDDEETSYRLSQGFFDAHESDGQVSITVHRDGDSTNGGSVVLSTSDTDAISPDDYIGTAVTVNFNPGQRSETVGIGIVDDEVLEVPERFSVSLRDANDGVISTPHVGTVTIQDDDASVSFSQGTITAEEGDTVRVAIVKRGYLRMTSTVLVSGGSATASSGTDYEFTTQPVEFGIDETVKYVSVAINDNDTQESMEYLQLNLQNVDGAVQGEPNAAKIEIMDNEASVSFSQGTITAEEGETVRIAIVRQGYLRMTSTVLVSGGSATASSGTDYEFTSQPVEFGIDETVKYVSVAINDDDTQESMEYLQLNLQNVDGAIQGEPNAAKIVILENDGSAAIPSTNNDELSGGGIAGIVIGSVVGFLTLAILSIIALLILRRSRGGNSGISQVKATQALQDPDGYNNQPILYDGTPASRLYPAIGTMQPSHFKSSDAVV